MTSDSAKVVVCGPGAGDRVDVLGADITIKTSQSAKRMLVCEQLAEPGYATPFHAHESEDEMLYVLSGEVVFQDEEGEMPAGPGTMVYAPCGTHHGFANKSDKPARLLFVTSPGGKLEGAFRSVDQASQGGKVMLEPAQAGAIFAANGVVVA